MKKTMGVYLQLIAVIMCLYLSTHSVNAQEEGSKDINDLGYSLSENQSVRDLYIGDEISLEIQAKGISEVALREAFEGMEIISFEKDEEVYRLIVTGYEPGEQEIQLPGQKLLIHISSTLDAIKRESIFEEELTYESGEAKQISLMAVLGLGILLIILYLPMAFKLFIRKEKQMKPFELFIQSIEKIDASCSDALYEMTMILKRYLSNVLGVSLEGLTTEQIIEVLDNQEVIMKEDLTEWMVKCDQLKYKPVAPLPEVIKDLKEQLLQYATRFQQEERSAIE